MAVRRGSVPSPPSPKSEPDRIKIPSWDLDPTWSLSPWPVVLQFGSTEVEIPAMPAADWLTILMSGRFGISDLFDLIPDIDDLIIDGDVELEQVSDIFLDMITTVSSRHWWITLRLIGIARGHWDTIGPEMITKVDASTVSLAAWMTVLQLTIIKSMDPKSVPMFIAQVQAPPFGTQAPQVQQQELSRGEFLAMAR